MNFIIISTLLHYISIYPLLIYNNYYELLYIFIIIISTTFSVLYHYYQEANLFINIIDYSLAFLWLIYDLIFALYIHHLFEIALSNIFIFLINIYIPYNYYYKYLHTIWHILSAIKCFYVSTLIKTYPIYIK